MLWHTRLSPQLANPAVYSQRQIISARATIRQAASPACPRNEEARLLNHNSPKGAVGMGQARHQPRRAAPLRRGACPRSVLIPAHRRKPVVGTGRGGGEKRSTLPDCRRDPPPGRDLVSLCSAKAVSCKAQNSENLLGCNQSPCQLGRVGGASASGTELDGPGLEARTAAAFGGGRPHVVCSPWSGRYCRTVKSTTLQSCFVGLSRSD